MQRIKRFFTVLFVAPFFIVACVCEDLFKNLNPSTIFLVLCITLSGGILIGKSIDKDNHRCYIIGKMRAYEIIMKISNPNFQREIVSKDELEMCNIEESEQ